MTELQDVYDELNFMFRSNPARIKMNLVLDKYRDGLKTLKNNDSSADNTSDEQLHSDAELVSKIEDMAVKHGHGSFKWSGEVSLDSNQFENFTTDIVKLFKTYINHVSEPVKPELDNYIDQLRIRDLKQVCESHRLSITDSYEQGLANGLELAIAIIESREPVFLGKTTDRKRRW